MGKENKLKQKKIFFQKNKQVFLKLDCCNHSGKDEREINAAENARDQTSRSEHSGNSGVFWLDSSGTVHHGQRAVITTGHAEEDTSEPVNPIVGDEHW